MWTVGFFGFFCFVGLGDGTVFIGHRKDDDDFNWHHCEFIYWQIYIYICLCRYRMYILPVCCIYFMSSSCPKISFGVKESHWSEQACTGITFPPHDLILHHFAPTSCTNRIALIPLFKKKNGKNLSLRTVPGPQHVVCFLHQRWHCPLTLRRYLLHAFEALQKPGSEEISAVMSSTSRVKSVISSCLRFPQTENCDWKTMGMNIFGDVGDSKVQIWFSKSDLPNLFFLVGV